MENTFFLCSKKDELIQIERFHLCTWEFENNGSLVEFGFEVNAESFQGRNQINLSLFIPWLSDEDEVKDLYKNLSDSANSRFIFNDSVNNTSSLDGGDNKRGVIHNFRDRNTLCILPVTINKASNRINLSIELEQYNNHAQGTNVYFRFWVKPKAPISTKKKGINKSTIIYDIKINERRNIPDNIQNELNNLEFCKIKTCFCFNILPNRYDMVFFDNTSLKSVRTLEFDSFNKYLGDKRVKKDELIVVFNKKDKAESFSFFSIYSNERVGPAQFALAVLINIICGVLLFIPAYRKAVIPELGLFQVWKSLPIEIYISLLFALITAVYFIWPTIMNGINNIIDMIKVRFNKKK